MARPGLLTTAEHLPFKDFIYYINKLHEDGEYLWELYCCLAFSTGLRASDVLSLKWKDVLGKKYLMRREIKTQKARLIKLNEEFDKKITALYDLLGQPNLESYAIQNNKTGKAYSIWTVNRAIQKYRDRYGMTIRAFSTHSFRKTFGRYVYDSWENKSEALILLQNIFRHDESLTTMRYIGIVQDDIDVVFNSISFTLP